MLELGLFFKVFSLIVSMIFISVIMAAMRNNGVGSIENFTFPEFEYWNPIIHEYGTTYHIYNLIINQEKVIQGYEVFGQSYLDTFINLLPSNMKPEGFISYSNAISQQYGVNGEGLGNSPVSEVIYNGYFPAIIFQTFPFLLIFFLLSSRFHN